MREPPGNILLYTILCEAIIFIGLIYAVSQEIGHRFRAKSEDC